MRDWKISLWAGRAVLALFFAYAGFLKLSRTPEALAAMGWHWTVDVPPSLITFIGIMEVLGAIGIIFPAALRLLPWLATLSAAGMLLLQLAAVALLALLAGQHNIIRNLEGGSRQVSGGARFRYTLEATVRAVAPDNVIAPVHGSLSRCGRDPWSR
jgi:uncharacterized membrane protein YphA (DoxX/SURF4 family)